MNYNNISSEQRFLDVFTKCLKIEAKTISIRTLLSDRNLGRINYQPYYQRNYVWDKIKQSFFIESVILGTEIPPLIFFKSGLKIEVIDGRQRFETLKKFKEGEVRLDGKGLMNLEFLARHNISTLDAKIRDTFYSSNIRIFEFEIVNYPEVSNEIEDQIKKEIFRRYNTGITPLTSSEVDTAKYLDDELSKCFIAYIAQNEDKAKKIYRTFISSDLKGELPKEDVTNYLRRLYILDKFPIVKYAGGSSRVETLGLLYDFVTQDITDHTAELQTYTKQIDRVLEIHDFFVQKGGDRFRNKLIYECILWALRILDNEKVDFTLDLEKLYRHYLDKFAKYEMLEYHFYGQILKRFSDTADYFNALTGFDFSLYIRDNSFSQYIKDELNKKSQQEATIDKFDNLRYNKPAPISTPIEEILADVKANRYIIRPAYQRQEKISVLKSSAIIESILLGINLPPLFIYKRSDGSKEVIDGQQRLLSILGFLGQEYKNEKGQMALSKNNFFRLKGLKILKSLNGLTLSKLTDEYRDKILDFTIDIIIIEEALNKNFDPTDLFIRLNNKPYPIKSNSFEMWNSTVDSDVIRKIKDVTNQHIEWFFIKETSANPEERNDRMDNEEFITILSYISYNAFRDGFDKAIGFFRRNEIITCRLKYKTGLSEFLARLENEALEKEAFLNEIDKTNSIISELGNRIKSDSDPTKEDLNEYLNVNKRPTFRRSLQDFYVMWIYLLGRLPSGIGKEQLDGAREMIAEFRGTEGVTINDEYVSEFESKLKALFTFKNSKKGA